MSISLPNLPYDMDSLEPHISAETMGLHYGRHHKGYIDKLNKQIDGTPLADKSLEDIITHARDHAEIGMLNNAAQAWNHTFLWESMTPNGAGKPSGRLMELVDSAFGDVDGFKKEFKESALGQFGSGWTWLVLDGNKPRIMSTSNAESPVATHLVPLLTLDVWEHAYYVDYQNERNRYIDAFLENLINWKFAAANLDGVAKAA